MRFYNTGKCKFVKTDKGEAADLAVPGQNPGAAVVYGRTVEARQCIDLADDLIASDILREHPSLVAEKDMPAAKSVPAAKAKE